MCFEEDTFAAIDDAIADGVNVLSISLGSSKPAIYVEDPIAMGALYATKKNVVVACSAGNFGPRPSTLSNITPWTLSVGASNMDRKFIASAVLGNGMIIEVIKLFSMIFVRFKKQNKKNIILICLI